MLLKDNIQRIFLFQSVDGSMVYIPQDVPRNREELLAFLAQKRSASSEQRQTEELESTMKSPVRRGHDWAPLHSKNSAAWVTSRGAHGQQYPAGNPSAILHLMPPPANSHRTYRPLPSFSGTWSVSTIIIGRSAVWTWEAIHIYGNNGQGMCASRCWC